MLPPFSTNARTSILVLITASTFSWAQQPATPLLDFSAGALPACAQQCQLLQAAQGGCVPPAAPVTDQTNYKACFCQSAYLQPLYAGPNGVCDAVCTPDLLPQIRNWYLGQCQNNGASPSSAPPASSTAPPANSAPAVATATASSIAEEEAGPKGNWWANHWKWVLMVIIIFFGLVGATVAGVYYKRRHKRKAEEHAAAMATPIVWGPHQHQHFTEGHASYGAAPARGASGRGSRKGKGKARQKTTLSQSESAA
ncbi:MAG: hypothetical protein M1817_001739 [Caeruleum heppii]|nr:MAG: hypothetical protein M1817_001739 [Caeruleum heppii]